MTLFVSSSFVSFMNMIIIISKIMYVSIEKFTFKFYLGQHE